MYPISAIDSIIRFESQFFRGDSEGRYPSREAFHAAHAPSEPIRCTGRVVGKVIFHQGGGVTILSVDENGVEGPDETGWDPEQTTET